MLGTGTAKFSKEAAKELKRLFKKNLTGEKGHNDLMNDLRNSSWDVVIEFMTGEPISWYKRMRVYRSFNSDEQLKFLSLIPAQFLKKILEHLSYEENTELKEILEAMKII